jgi:hypothetical protein
MPRAGLHTTRDLLDKATQLRMSIDYRRGILVHGKPGFDRIEVAVQLVRMEQDLARIEKTLVARGREIARTLSNPNGERPMTTLQSMMTARPGPSSGFALPQLSPSLDGRAIQVPKKEIAQCR